MWACLLLLEFAQVAHSLFSSTNFVCYTSDPMHHKTVSHITCETRGADEDNVDLRMEDWQVVGMMLTGLSHPSPNTIVFVVRTLGGSWDTGLTPNIIYWGRYPLCSGAICLSPGSYPTVDTTQPALIGVEVYDGGGGSYIAKLLFSEPVFWDGAGKFPLNDPTMFATAIQLDSSPNVKCDNTTCDLYFIGGGDGSNVAMVAIPPAANFSSDIHTNCRGLLTPQPFSLIVDYSGNRLILDQIMWGSRSDNSMFDGCVTATNAIPQSYLDQWEVPKTWMVETVDKDGNGWVDGLLFQMATTVLDETIQDALANSCITVTADWGTPLVLAFDTGAVGNDSFFSFNLTENRSAFPLGNTGVTFNVSVLASGACSSHIINAWYGGPYSFRVFSYLTDDGAPAVIMSPVYVEGSDLVFNISEPFAASLLSNWYSYTGSNTVISIQPFGHKMTFVFSNTFGSSDIGSQFGLSNLFFAEVAQVPRSWPPVLFYTRRMGPLVMIDAQISGLGLNGHITQVTVYFSAALQVASKDVEDVWLVSNIQVQEESSNTLVNSRVLDVDIDQFSSPRVLTVAYGSGGVTDVDGNVLAPGSTLLVNDTFPPQALLAYFVPGSSTTQAFYIWFSEPVRWTCSSQNVNITMNSYDGNGEPISASIDPAGRSLFVTLTGPVGIDEAQSWSLSFDISAESCLTDLAGNPISTLTIPLKVPTYFSFAVGHANRANVDLYLSLSGYTIPNNLFAKGGIRCVNMTQYNFTAAREPFTTSDSFGIVMLKTVDGRVLTAQDLATGSLQAEVGLVDGSGNPIIGSAPLKVGPAVSGVTAYDLDGDYIPETMTVQFTDPIHQGAGVSELYGVELSNLTYSWGSTSVNLTYQIVHNSFIIPNITVDAGFAVAATGGMFTLSIDSPITPIDRVAPGIVSAIGSAGDPNITVTFNEPVTFQGSLTNAIICALPTPGPTQAPIPPTTRQTPAPITTSAPITNAPSTRGPTSAPTAPTTLAPTSSPTTGMPTLSPTPPTTLMPTGAPITDAPTTLNPTSAPTAPPTDAPSPAPSSLAPTNPPLTDAPSAMPTAFPSPLPTMSPTTSPTASPSAYPTNAPTQAPITQAPTTAPTTSPTTTSPTTSPTLSPTTSPTTTPSLAPTTWAPTPAPTMAPSTSPTTIAPSTFPTTIAPSTFPTTIAPSTFPTTIAPSTFPTTIAPSTFPTTIAPSTTVAPTTLSRPTTGMPSKAPTTLNPTKAPTTLQPTKAPVTFQPTTLNPTLGPTRSPTTSPTNSPSTLTPTRAPSTRTPTRAPSTRTPTFAPITHAPTQSPSTMAPTTIVRTVSAVTPLNPSQYVITLAYPLQPNDFVGLFQLTTTVSDLSHNVKTSQKQVDRVWTALSAVGLDLNGDTFIDTIAITLTESIQIISINTDGIIVQDLNSTWQVSTWELNGPVIYLTTYRNPPGPPVVVGTMTITLWPSVIATGPYHNSDPQVLTVDDRTKAVMAPTQYPAISPTVAVVLPGSTCQLSMQAQGLFYQVSAVCAPPRGFLYATVSLYHGPTYTYSTPFPTILPCGARQVTVGDGTQWTYPVNIVIPCPSAATIDSNFTPQALNALGLAINTSSTVSTITQLAVATMEALALTPPPLPSLPIRRNLRGQYLSMFTTNVPAWLVQAVGAQGCNFFVNQDLVKMEELNIGDVLRSLSNAPPSIVTVSVGLNVLSNFASQSANGADTGDTLVTRTPGSTDDQYKKEQASALLNYVDTFSATIVMLLNPSQTNVSYSDGGVAFTATRTEANSTDMLGGLNTTITNLQNTIQVAYPRSFAALLQGAAWVDCVIMAAPATIIAALTLTGRRCETADSLLSLNCYLPGGAPLNIANLNPIDPLKITIPHRVVVEGEGSQCSFWENTTNALATRGCVTQVGINDTTCLCTHATTFSLQYIPTANRITDSDFTKLTNENVAKNPVPLITVCMLSGVFAVMAVFAYKRDQRENDDKLRDEKTRKYTEAAQQAQTTSFAHEFWSEVRMNHMWVAVIWRRFGDPFRSKHRLACLAANVYLTFLMNGVWYRSKGATANNAIGSSIASALCALMFSVPLGFGFQVAAKRAIKATNANHGQKGRGQAHSIVVDPNDPRIKSSRRIMIACSFFAGVIVLLSGLLIIVLGLSFDLGDPSCLPQGSCFCTFSLVRQKASLGWLGHCFISLAMDIVLMRPLLLFAQVLFRRNVDNLKKYLCCCCLSRTANSSRSFDIALADVVPQNRLSKASRESWDKDKPSNDGSPVVVVADADKVNGNKKSDLERASEAEQSS